MKVWLIVGSTGQGKTTFSRDLINKIDPDRQRVITFDVNNEHHDLNPIYPDLDELLNLIENSRGRLFFIEDATSFFSNRGHEERFKKALVAKRHTSNAFICLFHSMADVPKYILRLSNYLVLFKTIDSAEVVGQMYKGMTDVLSAFEASRNNKVGECEIVTLA